MSLKAATFGVLLLTPILGCVGSTSSTPEANPFGPGLQFHWAEMAPRDGLIEMTVLGTESKLYLYPEILLTESDVEAASAFPAEEGPAIGLDFTAQGQEKMARLTAKNEDRLLAIVVDGVLITAPKLKGPMSKNAKIYGTFSMAEAERLARRIKPHSLGPPSHTEKATPTSNESETARVLPAELVADWTAAGAELGWAKDGEFDFHRDGEGRYGEVPTFRFNKWNAGVLAKLPPPRRDFGLSLYSTELTDAGIKELAGMTRLQLLDLGFSNVTDAGMRELARFTGLQALDLAHTRVTDAGLRELAGLTDLRVLFLENCEVTDAGLSELAGFQKLEWLNLKATRVSNAGLKKLAGLQRLQSLTLDYTFVTDAGLKELTTLKNLQRLSIGSGIAITDNALKEVGQLQGLQWLWISSPKVTATGLKELTRLPDLKHLILLGTPVTDGGLKELASLKGLQTLTLYGTQVTDTGLRELAELKEMQMLSIGDTRVTDAGLKALVPMITLQSLDLSSTQVSDGGLKELTGLKSLRHLDLRETQVSDAGVAALKQALPKLSVVR